MFVRLPGRGPFYRQPQIYKFQSEDGQSSSRLKLKLDQLHIWLLPPLIGVLVVFIGLLVLAAWPSGSKPPVLNALKQMNHATPNQSRAVSACAVYSSWGRKQVWTPPQATAARGCTVKDSGGWRIRKGKAGHWRKFRTSSTNAWDPPMGWGRTTLRTNHGRTTGGHAGVLPLGAIRTKLIAC